METSNKSKTSKTESRYVAGFSVQGAWACALQLSLRISTKGQFRGSCVGNIFDKTLTDPSVKTDVLAEDTTKALSSAEAPTSDLVCKR